MAENPLKYNQAVARLGLNTDNLPDEIKPGMLTYALNAQVSNFDGSAVSYQNEQANIECITLPEGYKVIGVKNITSLKKVVYFLTNPTTTDSEIGYSDNNECKYNTLITDKGNDQKFNFNINFPIHKVIVKLTNCSTQLYWTDGFNPRRWMDLEDLPWKEQRNPDNDYQPIKLVGQLDANKLLVQANFSIPTITPIEVDLGGSLVMGTYQFAIQYSNALGDGYTSYYNVTNPISIFEAKTTPDFNLKTSKAIAIEIDNIDTTGLYDYFNIAVIKNINNITTVELVGTFPVTIKDGFRYVYTGDNVQQIALTINDIFEKFPYYEVAQDVFEVDNVLGWDNLTKKERINYQPIWNKVLVNWETWKIPYTKFEGYSNGINTAEIRGYMRDEVYPLEGCFILENGEQTDSFHIPGRVANVSDLAIVPLTNKDSLFTDGDPCDPIDVKQRWKVYNTAKKLGKYPGTEDACYVGPYEYGEFAYWESQELYPNNKDIWGDLVNTPIRHHKFPDSVVTHIHDNNDIKDKDYEHSIFPIGIKVDVESLYKAIDESDLPADEKAKIIGFKIARGNRSTNKSIIAKGLFNNVGKYKYKDENETYYPNYPYNDLRPDPFFAKSEPNHHSGLQTSLMLDGFATDEAKSRFTFHSPDTHFYQPFGIDEGQLKIETIEYGESYGKFVELKENAEYKFSTRELLAAAGAIGIMFAIDLSKSKPSIRGIDGAQAFLSAKDLMERLLPYNNYGAMYSSTGLYNKYVPVNNDNGDKIRTINFGKYLNDGVNSIEEGKLLNNTRRESSVYINTTDTLKFPQQYSTRVPEDNSRLINSQGLKGLSIEEFFNRVKPMVGATPSFDSLTDTTPSSTYEEVTEKVTEKISTLSIYPIEVQMLALYAVSTTYGLNYDVFTKINPTTGTGFNDSAFSYVMHLLRTVTSFEEFASWSAYEFICDNYSTIDVEFPSPDDLNMIDINAFKYDEATESMIPTVITTCLASLKYLAFLTLVNASGLYNTSNAEPFDGISNTEVERNISSYYGSIKRYIPSQWGRMYSYETIDTGFYTPILDDNKQRYTDFRTIFGGDIFINRFAYKTKLSVYNRTTVNLPNGADINLKKAGQLGYPMFWISTEPMTENLGITSEDIQKIYAQVGGVNTAAIIGTAAQTIGGLTMNVGGALIISGIGAPLGLALVIGGAVVSLVGGIIKLFSSGKAASDIAKTYIKLIKGIVEGLGVKNTNLDNYKTIGLSEKGIIYHYIYGHPYFFVESEVNADNRQAYNDLEGNFYPNVGGFIPDEWNQEANVPILYDNTYTYNQSYSKQNKENYFSHLREDYDPNKLCNTDFPNRAIYSDKSTLEETKNNWLTYRPVAYFDFPKSYGKLISLDNLENIRVLARFENKSQIYNTMTTIKIDGPQDAYLGNGKLFSSAPPIDLSETDIGYAGSQHKLLLRTEFGDIFTDSARGQIILLQGTKITNIADNGMESFFQENLPFYITDKFPTVNIDNNFNGFGLHGVYDLHYKRFIITKIDYEVIGDVTMEANKFYVDGVEVFLTDKKYFVDKSFTLSYSFVTNSWISYHSYIPNYYIPNITYFQSGLNIGTSKLWNHNQSIGIYNTYYGSLYPYILEYPFVAKYQDEILQNVKEYMNVRVYDSINTFFEPQEIIYYNKSIIYNDEQSTGVLNLIPSPKNNLAAKFSYPKYNLISKDILVSKSDNFYNYNTFWNIVKNEGKSFFSSTTDYRYTDKELNDNVLDYSQRNHLKSKLRGKSLKIRHILDDKNNYKFISRFIINNTVNSYK